jgi:hypothetical protein
MSSKLSFETKIGLLALITSIFAIGISSYQAYLQRMQTYASVMPRLDMFTYSYRFDDAKELDLNEFKISVKNSGVGPANIDSFQVIINDEKYKFFNEPFTKITNNDDFEISNMWTNRMISSGEVIHMISAKGLPALKLIDTIQGDVLKMKVKVHYSSIYKERWEFQFSNYEPITTVKL